MRENNHAYERPAYEWENKPNGFLDKSDDRHHRALRQPEKEEEFIVDEFSRECQIEKNGNDEERKGDSQSYYRVFLRKSTKRHAESKIEQSRG
jgi:hypothetical protein